MTRLRDSRPTGSDGLFAAERGVLELWDDGASIEEIAEARGMAVKRVRDVVSTYGAGGNDVAKWEASVRASTRALFEAVARTGKSFS